MSDAIETLRRVELFEHLSDAQLALLAAQSRELSFRKHAVLMTEGEVGESMYVMTSGLVKVFVGDEDGRELVLYELGPGAVIGDIALLDDAPRSASAATLARSTALMIGKGAFLACLRESPEMGINIIRSLTARLRRATDGSRRLALDNVYRRLAERLRELAEDEGGGEGGGGGGGGNGDRGSDGSGSGGGGREADAPTLPRKYSHQELGSMIGASREMVGKVMAELVRGGYVELRDGRIALVRKLPKDW